MNAPHIRLVTLGDNPLYRQRPLFDPEPTAKPEQAALL